ncbi:MAG: hypothetical protein EOS84_10465 [Mesorhizobium sp.]|nr:MAG: hypothetical protein EOS84_10465 [Mesorhizobium sp.]
MFQLDEYLCLRPRLNTGSMVRSPTPHFFQHPSSVSALRADPPSPTRGEGRAEASALYPDPSSALSCTPDGGDDAGGDNFATGHVRLLGACQ